MPKTKISMSDTIAHKKIGFSNKLYKVHQKEAILDRLSKFPSGTLYLEIGGHFLNDTHAERVLPGFQPNIKPKIFDELGISYNIIFCISAKDLKENRMLTENSISYKDRVIEILEKLSAKTKKEIIVAINLVSDSNRKEVNELENILEEKKYKTFERYIIKGYPEANKVISSEGYGKDEFYDNDTSLTLIIGPASNSGKLSTALGQVYHDLKQDKESGYAKFELFPIWNLPLKHPVNIAYEAATADINDYNAIDPFHLKSYNETAVNYNRDIDAFPIINTLIKKMVPKTNYISSYKSPTDMGMNMAGFAITDSKICALAGVEEIKRRQGWYEEQAKEGRGRKLWSKRCIQLTKEAKEWLSNETMQE